MTPAQLVTDLRERGVSLSLRGDRLSFESTLPIDKGTLEGLKENKPVLVAYLSHPLLYRLREEGMLFHAREGKLQPKAEEHAAYAKVLERETERYLAWAKDLLDTYPYVCLESPYPWKEGYVVASHFKHIGKLAKRRIWLDTWDLWGVVTHDSTVLESWGEGPNLTKVNNKGVDIMECDTPDAARNPLSSVGNPNPSTKNRRNR